jgi:hypothetical protein
MQFSITIDFIVIAPLGPRLMRVFGIDTAEFGWTVAAYAFGAGLSSFSAAFFLDRFDRKRALLGALHRFHGRYFLLRAGTRVPCDAPGPIHDGDLRRRLRRRGADHIVGEAIPEIRRYGK